MSIEDTYLPAHWHYYLNHSLQTDLAPCNDLGHGREEQLWETLAVIQKGLSFNDAIRDRLDRMPWNRAKKHRRLWQRLASKAAVRRIHEDDAPQFDSLSRSDAVTAVRKMMNDDQWAIEWELASGATYVEVATTLKIHQGTLKVRVMRWREKIRANSLVA